jgi:F-box and WD-40 domain protein CDC4
VTGGSDGSVRVWSLEKMCPIHRLAAHDNSVTSLQFDDTRVVSGGSDGRVKIWDLKTGHLVRELIAQCEAVWRVAFEDEKCVALTLRQGRTVMEVSLLVYTLQMNFTLPFSFSSFRLGSTNPELGLVILPSRRDAL